MAILLVRHAEAVAERPGIDDAARWLSARGRDQAREVGQALRAKGLVPARAFASPRVRAVQTGELVLSGLGFSGVLEALPSLSYTAPAERAAAELAALEEELAGAPAVLAAFGHMPTIAEIAAKLTNGAHRQPLGLSEALLLEQGRVVWSVAPR